MASPPQKKHNLEEPHMDGNESDEAPMPMPSTKPKKRKVLKFENLYLDNLPQADMYEMSYMHRDVVTHVLVTPKTDFLVTASKDGHVKFWKKMNTGIEFVKHYKSHLSEINCLDCSIDGLRLCSTSNDQNIKFYDIMGFDMIHIIKVLFIPTCCKWIFNIGDLHPLLAVADKNSSAIRIYNAEGNNESLHIIQRHHAPITTMAFNSFHNVVISGDKKGNLEYWSTKTFDFPKESGLQFKLKLETDLYDLAKCKTFPTSIEFCPNGKNFVLTARDKQVRVFRFDTGKMRRKYDEGLTVFEDAQADGALKLDSIDFGRRLAVERELEASEDFQLSNAIFDESGHFVLYATLLGIKMINIETNKLVKVLGRVENTERFINISLYQGIPKVSSQYNTDTKPRSMDETKEGNVVDPLIFTTAFKKNRFFYFSKREPISEDDSGQGRDIFNEKPTKEETEVAPESTKSALGTKAVIHTTVGDIMIKLFLDECPKTIENFCVHSRNGYFDGVVFHRVIKNFMIQTGDPLGDGTGGESIWGGEFQDEFHRNLRHDRPFTVSMANAGPNTNGSQFFITTVPTPWLDNKHTVFGRVENGMDTIGSIENVRTDKMDKPYDDIKIVNIDILA